MNRKFCTACGAMVPEGSSFCGACGTPVQAAGPADRAVAPPAEMPASPPPRATPAEATPAEADVPAPPTAAPTAEVPAAPPPMAMPVHAPPPVSSSNTHWKKIGLGILGAGLLILGAWQIYNAFFGAPINSSAVRQMENKIRSDFQARGQTVSRVQLTPQDRDRMTGYVTVGNAAVPGSELRYNCTATRQDGSYFRYRCEPASGTSENTTLSPGTPPGAPMASAGDAGTNGSALGTQCPHWVDSCPAAMAGKRAPGNAQTRGQLATACRKLAPGWILR